MAEQIVARCYMRVSTEEQAQSGYSLAAQREKLELFAQLQGYVIGGWYRDDGVSAKDLNRPEFQRMMAEAGRGDVILVYKLDRLTRSVRDLDELLRRFEQDGLHFRSVTEQFDTTTATGRLMIRMVGEFAQWERETIAERTAFGKRKKIASGEWGGGRPPFGYTLAPSDKVKGGRTLMKLVPDPDTAPLVVSIFEKYLAGHGLRSISTWLNESIGARSALGRAFDAIKVGRILQNPMYLGMLQSDAGLVPSTHQPLVSREVFERVRETFALRKRMAPRQATGAYALSGVARCGVCGGSICVRTHRRGARAGQYYYACRNYTFARGCGGRQASLTSAPGPLMEQQLLTELLHLSDPEELAAFYRSVEAEHERRMGVTAPAIAQVQAGIAEAAAAIQRWDALYEIGRLEMAEYLKRTEPHAERLKLLRARLEAAQKEPAPPPKEVLAQFPVTFRDVWAEADPHEKKALLQQFVAAWDAVICLYPGQHLELRPAKSPDR